MQYRPHRYPTDCAVTVSTSYGSAPASVVDVSRSGARLRGVGGLNRGDKLQLQALSNQMEAVVLWARSGYVGISFRPAINDFMLDVLRKRIGGHGRYHTHGMGLRYAELR